MGGRCEVNRQPSRAGIVRQFMRSVCKCRRARATEAPPRTVRATLPLLESHLADYFMLWKAARRMTTALIRMRKAPKRSEESTVPRKESTKTRKDCTKNRPLNRTPPEAEPHSHGVTTARCRTVNRTTQSKPSHFSTIPHPPPKLYNISIVFRTNMMYNKSKREDFCTAPYQRQNRRCGHELW